MEVFQRLGYEGTSLAELSKATGLVKASLYHHFPGGKKAMAEAAIDRSAQLMCDLVVTPLLGEGPALARLENMLAGIDQYYRGGADLCLFAVFSIGHSHTLFYPRMAPHLKIWFDSMARVIGELGVSADKAAAQAEHMAVTIEGALVVARASSNPEVFARALDRLRAELRALAQ